MISDLPLCDRLSLKGKIFELQKKLQLIDLEHKLDEQYSYKPTILEYDLPNRQTNFLENINKADIIRKQRKELLHRSATQQSDEACTFAPKLLTKKHHSFQDDRPVFQRLSDKGKVYEDQLERKKQFYHSFDTDGNRLFTPKVNKRSAKLVDHSPDVASNLGNDSSVSRSAINNNNSSVHNNSASADEFLYQDAKDRELRFQQKLQLHEQQLHKQASQTKMNATSKQLLLDKADKFAVKLFSLMDVKNIDSIDYASVALLLETSKAFAMIDKEKLLHYQELFWNMINHYQMEKVDRKDFTDMIRAFLLHDSKSSIVAYLHCNEENRIESLLDKTGQGIFNSRSSNLSSLKKQSFLEFKQILMKLIEEAKESKAFSRLLNKNIVSLENAQEADPVTFQPQICRKSYQLAEKKELKEQNLLASLPALSPVNNNAATQNISLDDKSELDTSHDGRNNLVQDNRSISTGTRSSQLNLLHERLLARGLLSQHKKENLAQKIRKQQLRHCTFQPKVTNWKKKPTDVDPQQPKPNTAAENIIEQQSADEQEKAQANEASDSAGLNTSNELSNVFINVEELPMNTSEELNLFFESGHPSGSHGNQQDEDKEDGDETSTQQQEIQLNTNVAVYDRLYALKDKKPASTINATPSYMQELKQCTFAPQIKAPPSSFKKASATKISGFNRSVDRIRAVNEQKRKQEEEEAQAWKKREESYQKSRELSKKGAIPFNFALEQRRQMKTDGKGEELNSQQQQQLQQQPSLIIDVKISAAKTARIKVLVGDDPEEVAKRFGKIYGLDTGAVQVLGTVVKKSMVQGGLIPPDYPSSSPSRRQSSFDVNEQLSEEDEEEYSSYTESDLSFYDEDTLEEDDDYPYDNDNEGARPHHHHSHSNHHGQRKKGRRRSDRRVSLLSQLL